MSCINTHHVIFWKQTRVRACVRAHEYTVNVYSKKAIKHSDFTQTQSLIYAFASEMRVRVETWPFLCETT